MLRRIYGSFPKFLFNPVVWFCLAGVCLNLILGSYYSFGRYENLLFYLLTLSIGSLGIFLLFHKPPLGPILFISACLLLPFGIGVGGTSVNIAVIAAPMLIAICMARILLHRSEHRLIWSRSMLPLVLLSICGFLSFVAGQFRWFPSNPASLSTQLAGLGVLFFSAGLCILVPQEVRESLWLKRLLWVFLILGALRIGSKIVSTWVSLPRIFAHGADGSLFWTWLACLAFSQSVFNTELSRATRASIGLIVISVFYVNLLLAGSWASGWIPPLAGIGTIIIVSNPRAGITLAFFSTVLLVLQFERLWSWIMVSEHYSWITRLEAWGIIINMATVSPLFGLGPSNYRFYTHLQPILGWNVEFNSHNNYVDIFAQMGLLGLICFAWFIGEVAWLGWRLRRRFSAGFERAFVFGALGGLAGTLVAGMLGDWIIPFIYNIGLDGFRASALGWLFLGGLLALDRMSQARRYIGGYQFEPVHSNR